jgi:hypothetical protein
LKEELDRWFEVWSLLKIWSVLISMTCRHGPWDDWDTTACRHRTCDDCSIWFGLVVLTKSAKDGSGRPAVDFEVVDSQACQAGHSILSLEHISHHNWCIWGSMVQLTSRGTPRLSSQISVNLTLPLCQPQVDFFLEVHCWCEWWWFCVPDDPYARVMHCNSFITSLPYLGPDFSIFWEMFFKCLAKNVQEMFPSSLTYILHNIGATSEPNIWETLISIGGVQPSHAPSSLPPLHKLGRVSAMASGLAKQRVTRWESQPG